MTSVPTNGERVMAWLKRRALGVILSAAATLTVISLFLPAMFDFIVDLMMIGLIALAGKLAN